MKINLKDLDVYRFVAFVLIFVLLFTLIYTAQVNKVVSFQNKILMEFIKDEKPRTTTSSTYTSPTTTNKYQGY